MRKDWDKLGEADTMLPESVVFHGDEPALGKADLFIPTFMVELIYTLNTLIRGKRRLEVQQLFMSTEGSLTILNRIIDAAVWLESDPNYVNIIINKQKIIQCILFSLFILKEYKSKYQGSCTSVYK